MELRIPKGVEANLLQIVTHTISIRIINIDYIQRYGIDAGRDDVLVITCLN